MTLKLALLIGGMAVAQFTGSAAAQVAAALQPASAGVATSPAGPPFLAWDSFTDELRQFGSKMMAKLPERLRNDPQVRQETGRLLLEALAERTIEAIGADGDHPVFLPGAN